MSVAKEMRNWKEIYKEVLETGLENVTIDHKNYEKRMDSYKFPFFKQFRDRMKIRNELKRIKPENVFTKGFTELNPSETDYSNENVYKLYLEATPEAEMEAAPALAEVNYYDRIRDIIQDNDKFEAYMSLLEQEEQIKENFKASDEKMEKYHKLKVKELFPMDPDKADQILKQEQENKLEKEKMEHLKNELTEKEFKKPFYIEDGKNIDDKLMVKKVQITHKVGMKMETITRKKGLVTETNKQKYIHMIESEKEAIQAAEKSGKKMTTKEIVAMHNENLNKTFGLTKALEIKGLEKEVAAEREKSDLAKQNEPKEFKMIDKRVKDMEKNKKEIISIVGNEENYNKFIHVIKKEAELKKQDIKDGVQKHPIETKKQFRNLLKDEFKNDIKIASTLDQYRNGEHPVQLAPKTKQKEADASHSL